MTPLTLSIEEAAKALRMSHTDVRALMRRKDDPLPFIIPNGKQRGWFIFTDDLKAWCARNCHMWRDS